MDTFLNIKKIIVAIPGIAMYLSFLRKVVTPAKARRGGALLLTGQAEQQEGGGFGHYLYVRLSLKQRMGKLIKFLRLYFFGDVGLFLF